MKQLLFHLFSASQPTGPDFVMIPNFMDKALPGPAAESIIRLTLQRNPFN